MSKDYEKPVIVLNSTSGKMECFQKISSSLKRVIILKMHQRRFENLPISSPSYENDVVIFTLKHRLRFEICACEMCEKFVYKHLEIIEYVKN